MAKRQPKKSTKSELLKTHVLDSDVTDPDVVGKHIKIPSLTDALIERIIAYIRKGNYIGVACGACGITRKQYEYWMRKGEEDLENYEEDTDATVYARFFYRVYKAFNLAETDGVQEFREGAANLWMRPITWLQRARPQRWNEKVQVQVEQSQLQAPIAPPNPPKTHEEWLKRKAERDNLSSGIIAQSGMFTIKDADSITEDENKKRKAVGPISVNTDDIETYDE
jgi:hypothetical protein